LIKPLITGKTFQKVEIFDSNASKYRPILEELISSSYLDEILCASEDFVQEIDNSMN